MRVPLAGRARRWWRRLSLRARLLFIGTGGLAAGFALGGVVLVAALSYALVDNVDREALGTARDVAALADAGALPEPVPVPGGQVVQVVDGQRRVRAASIGADRLVPLLRPEELELARTGQRRYFDGDRIGVDGPIRVVALDAGTRADPLTVLVAHPMQEVLHSVAVVRVALLVTYPLLLAGLAALAWRVVGATLRPVEALRAGAEAITGAETAAGPVEPGSGRLPVPRSRDEIHALAVTLNDMLDRLAAARARQRAFVADAAHELRSPLASMRTQLEVAQRLADPDAWPEVAEELLVDVERMTRLVADLLLLARADATARPPVPSEAVQLGPLLAEVVGRYRAARVPVRLAVTGAPQWIVGEPDAVRRMVANLVDNAVRHARSRVVVTLSPGAFVTVTDDGTGIGDADLERVFDRFTRLDDARARDDGGAGLGLAIVRELARRHGGTVRLTDAAPGIRAELRLPACGPPGDRSGVEHR